MIKKVIFSLVLLSILAVPAVALAETCTVEIDTETFTYEVPTGRTDYCESTCKADYPKAEAATGAKQNPYLLCKKRCCESPIASKEDIIKLIDRIANWFEIIVLAIAVLMLIYGGFIYITSGGDSDKAGTARKLLTYAIIGIAVVLLAWGAESLIRSFLQL